MADSCHTPTNALITRIARFESFKPFMGLSEVLGGDWGVLRLPAEDGRRGLVTNNKLKNAQYPANTADIWQSLI